MRRSGLGVFAAVISLLACDQGKPPPAQGSTAAPAAPAPAAEPALDFKLEANGPKESDQLRAAVALFRTSCRPLVEAASEVHSAVARRIRVWETSPWAKLGWGEVVQLQIQIKKSALHVNLTSAHAAGETLYYAMGGGKKPGIEAAKPPARKLCEITASDGWRSIPAAASLGLSDKPGSFGKAR
jgi:hypothetical protein